MVARTALQSPLRLLNDIAHLLESLDKPETRKLRVLGLLKQLIPHNGCTLLEVKDNGDKDFVILPEQAPEDAARLKAAMISCLGMITSDPLTALTGRSAPQIADSIPWGSYLGLPLVGNDRVIGLLFVGTNEPDAYEETDLSLLSVVAGQLGAYITSVNLYRQEHAAVEELRRSQAYARRLFDANLIGILEAEGDMIINANDAFLRIVGYTREDLAAGLNGRDMTPQEYAYLDERAANELETYGESAPFEKEYVRKSGSRVPILIGSAMTQALPLRQVCFILDLTERKRVEEELERTRSEFLGEVSHELKTPLTAIKGSTSMALASKRPPSEAEARELFAVIDEQAERLRELIGNLLDMTRIEAGSLSVNPQPVRLSQIVEEAVATFERTVVDWPVRTDMPPALPPVMADRRRIGQVISNLLSNAAKASPPATPIVISAERGHGEITVRVRDRGRGIAAAKMPLLFKKFAQVQESGGRGTGLGLAICKGIVESHGGHIWAESPAEGEGTTVSFTLPVATARPE